MRQDQMGDIRELVLQDLLWEETLIEFRVQQQQQQNAVMNGVTIYQPQRLLIQYQVPSTIQN
jgi:bifunctional N-acetylglucosamine-1-phosphate-uridyltransferase/glucosamine-1-phosphate-acetyltransferase GlmU-like protein